MRPIGAALAVWIIFCNAYAGPTALAASRNIRLATGASEPSIAVDPRHPSTVVVASIGGAPSGDKYPIGIYTSRNLARTFRTSSTPLPPPFTSATDPTVGIAGNGTLFVGYLTATPSFCNGPRGSGGIAVSASTNAGRSFRTPTVVDVNAADDKPAIAVESKYGHLSHVFVAWTYYHNGVNIMFSKSTDGGVSFQRPQILATSNLTSIGAVPVVGPQGHIFVFWASLDEPQPSSVGTGRILMADSIDDGTSFRQARTVVGSFVSVPRLLEPDSLRTVTFPAVAVTRMGRLYISWSAVTADHGRGAVDTSIFLVSSADAGKSWTSPAVVNDVRAGERFMPGLTTLSDESAAVAFYDRRNNGQLDVYTARATFQRGFHASKNLQVNDSPTRAADIYEQKPGQSACYSPGRYFGDYLGIAAGTGHTVFVTWGGAQMHTYGSTEVWISRVKLPGHLLRRGSPGRR